MFQILRVTLLSIFLSLIHTLVSCLRLLLSLPSIGGDYEIGRFVCLSFSVSVYTMTNNSNDVIALTAQTALPAVTLTSFPCSEAAFSSAFPFLVFTSLYLAEICTLTSTSSFLFCLEYVRDL